MADTSIYDTVLSLIGIDPGSVDDGKKTQINYIIGNTQNALKVRLGGLKDVPSELTYIVVEVSISRYNRLNNEGMSSYGQEGESIAFTLNDFLPFADDIKAWQNAQPVSNASLGNLKLINPLGGKRF